jgi:Lactoylglutathione lyase and related lyases
MAIKDDVLRPHHTAVCVTDFDRAKRFYIDFLGFTLEDEMDHRDEAGLGVVTGLPGAVIRWAMLSHGAHRIELFKYYSPPGDNLARRQCDLGYSHFAFLVKDVDAVYEQVVQAGYKTVSPPQTLRGGRARVFYCEEPEGAITEFAEFRQGAGSGRTGEQT